MSKHLVPEVNQNTTTHHKRLKKTNVWLKTFANVIKTHYICIRILTIVINTFLFSCLRFSLRNEGAVFLSVPWQKERPNLTAQPSEITIKIHFMRKNY